MSDLEHRLSDLAGTSAIEPDSATVADDLSRAHGALRHRRNRRARITSLCALATLGVAAAVVVGVDRDPGSAPAAESSIGSPPVVPESSAPPTEQPRTPSTTSATGADLRLVTYRGPQMPGFDVTALPDGFVLQGADNVSLAVARPGNRTPIYDFEHKIVVTVGLIDVVGPLDSQLVPIEVQGRPGTVQTERDGTIVVQYELDDERLAFVQAWNDVGISEQQLVDFADSLTISEDVETVS